MAWLGSSLLLDVLCCVRIISMPKPLRACTASSLFPAAMSPPSLQCLWLSAVCPLAVCSAWLVWWQLASFRVGSRLWELTQRNSALSWKCLCPQRVCVIMLSVGHAIPCLGRAAGTNCYCLRVFLMGRNNFPAKRRKRQHQGSGKKGPSVRRSCTGQTEPQRDRTTHMSWPG